MPQVRKTQPPALTFGDLAGLRWKCSSCEEWHSGPCLDFGFPEPYYWNAEWDRRSRWAEGFAGEARKPNATFLDSEFCSINGESFFVRGVIYLPILGTGESLCWGIWGSLSRASFEKLLELDGNPGAIDLPPMFSWLSSRIDVYPDTLNLKMYAHIQDQGKRPYFRLEPGDHPLAIEFHDGITPERVREIMLHHLPTCEL